MSVAVVRESHLQLEAASTRFLFPFRMECASRDGPESERASLDAVRKLFDGLSVRFRRDLEDDIDQPFWLWASVSDGQSHPRRRDVLRPQVDGRYTSELLTWVAESVFGDTDHDGPRYAQLNPQIVSRIFGKGVTADVPGKLQCALAALPVVEVFITRFRICTLSITLRWRLAAAVSLRETPFHGPSLARELTYAFSKLHRGARTARLTTDSADIAQSAIREQLGLRGPSFTLSELITAVLPASWAPLFDVYCLSSDDSARPGQLAGALTAYSVVRVAGSSDTVNAVESMAGEVEVDGGTVMSFVAMENLREEAAGFDDLALYEGAASLALGLSQIEEPTHAGALLRHDRPGRPVLRALDRCAMATCSSTGAAHIVLDQPDQDEFNRQRFELRELKYFVPYFLAWLQRVQSQEAVRSLSLVRMLPVRDRQPALRALRREMTEFAAEADYVDVSSRDAVEWWYEICQVGNRSRRALRRIHRLVREIDADLSNERARAQATATRRNLDEILSLQRHVEWVEVFIVAVYAVELVHIVSGALRFGGWYEGLSVVLMPLIAVAAMVRSSGLLTDRSAAGRKDHSNKAGIAARWGRGWILCILVALFMAWILVGIAAGTNNHLGQERSGSLDARGSPALIGPGFLGISW